MFEGLLGFGVDHDIARHLTSFEDVAKGQGIVEVTFN
jgi:hypothetical protein